MTYGVFALKTIRNLPKCKLRVLIDMRAQLIMTREYFSR